MIRTVLILFFLIFFSAVKPVSLFAQDVKAMIQQAEALEKAFNDDDALKKYIEVLKYDPLNIYALCKTSELYSIIGKRRPTKEEQKQYYKTGESYARKALKVNPNNSEANFAMAISMGRMALISSGKEKVVAVKEIKTYADRCIQLDPKNFKGYHVLGKWHYEVSDLNALEKWIVKITYGALPPSSLEDAIKNYEKSKALSPSFLLNYLELAKAYKRNGETEKARVLLQQLQKLPPTASDDVKIKSLGRKLLDDL
jgi:tetratricopeptide (TPR) repeat protein